MPTVMASVIGIPSKTTWPSTATRKVSLGEMWCACAFSGDEQSPHEGRKFIKFFENLLPESTADVYHTLGSAVAGMRPETAVSLAVVMRTKDSTLIMTFGFGVVGLVRQGQVRWLADGQKEQVVLEGDVREGDFLVLGTARGRELGLTDSLLAPADPDQIVASLFARAQQHAHSGEIALQLLRLESPVVQAAKQTEEPVEVSPPPMVSQSTTPTKHLISPKKLEAGILASSEEQKTAVRSLPRFAFADFVARFRGERIHWLRAAIVAAVLLLIVVVFVGYRAYSVGRERKEVLTPLEDLAVSLNSYGPDQRAQQRVAAQALLERLQATRITYNTNRRELEELTKQVETIYNSISGEKSVVNLDVFYDFRLVQADFLASKVSREKEQTVFLDANRPAMMRLNLTTKKNEKLPADGLETPQDVALNTGSVYTLNNNVIRKLSMSSAKHEDVIALPSLVEGTQLETFGESLYVFDRGGQQIWRVGTGEEASPSGWVRSAKGIDFSKVTSMVINGSIWLGSEDGEIFRLTRGERESFTITGLPEPFTSTLFLAVNQEGEKLAVVEPKSERLVILGKNGEYLLQVKSAQIGAVTDVILSEDEKFVYLVAGSVVYGVGIE